MDKSFCTCSVKTLDIGWVRCDNAFHVDSLIRKKLGDSGFDIAVHVSPSTFTVERLYIYNDRVIAQFVFYLSDSDWCIYNNLGILPELEYI